MKAATPSFLKHLDDIAEQRKQAILQTADEISIAGTTYYVSADGNDDLDGLTPATSWKTLAKVSSAALCPGDGVRFRRGDLFRGIVMTKPGVTYAAYGEGDKPKFYGWDKSLADPALWVLHDAEHHIWRMTELILDCGTLVFDNGKQHCRKLIPSYIGSRFVCRDREDVPFVMADEMTEDLDLFCQCDAQFTEWPLKGEENRVPEMNDKNRGTLYLRCDAGNPGEVFSEIEALPRRHMICVDDNPDVKIDNLCLKYIGCHGIAACGHVKGLHVTNCEFGWIGGTVQHYFGTDPNYPQGGRGTVTRYGNGVEIYGGCEDYLVHHCYFYEAYDAAITHQITTFGQKHIMVDVRYTDNLVENCVYSIEYFLTKNNGDTESYMDNIEISGNMLRFAGYGWGQQRHNTYTPAHIKSWNTDNDATRFTVHDNLFDRSAYRMLHIVAATEESCPQMYRNVYVQKYGMTLGQFGGMEQGVPATHAFFEDSGRIFKHVFKEKDEQVYYLD